MTSLTPLPIKKYRGFQSTVRNFVAAAWLVVTLVLTGITVYMLQGETRDSLFRSLPLVSVFVFWILGALYSFNVCPEIWTTEQGLFISYNFRRIFLPWSTITAVRGNSDKWLGKMYVYSTALPLFYFWYGIESFRVQRAFCIDTSLSDDDLNELLDFIELHSGASITVRSPKFPP